MSLQREGIMVIMATSTGQQRFDGVDPVDSRFAGRVLLLGGCALLGAAIWAGWLGWDSPAGDVAEYTSAQAGGCLVSIGVATAVLARWRNPLVVAGGTTFGCWVLSTAQTAADPEADALWAIGAAIALFALATITGVAAAVGYAWRRWRGPAITRPSPGRPAHLWRTGCALVVVGGCWLLVGAVARQAYPLGWTYSKVLHVPFDLLAAAAVVTGIFLSVRAVRRRRALRLPLRPLAPAGGLGAVLVLAVLVGRALPAGDGFTGQVGVMAGPDGAPVAVLGLYEGTVDSLLVLDLESERSSLEGDVPAARLDHDGGLDGVVVVDLTRPPSQWSGMPLAAAADDEDELNISATGRQSLLNDTYFTRAEVQQLAPGTVVYSVWEHPYGAYQGNEHAPLADFPTVACSGRGRNP